MIFPFHIEQNPTPTPHFNLRGLAKLGTSLTSPCILFPQHLLLLKHAKPLPSSSCLRTLACTLISAFAPSSLNNCSLPILRAPVQMCLSQKEHNYESSSSSVPNSVTPQPLTAWSPLEVIMFLYKRLIMLCSTRRQTPQQLNLVPHSPNNVCSWNN